MYIVVALLNIAFLSFIFYRIWSQEKSPVKKFFWPAFIIKLLAGIGLGFVYSRYYSTGDTFNYFEDGVKIAQLASEDFVSFVRFLWAGDDSFSLWTDLLYKQPRAMFLAKVTSFFCLLTANNYWIISLYFSAISFGGAWVLVKKIAEHKELLVPAVTSFLFFPSVVFWSAGIIKESLAMAALFFLSFIVLKIWRREKILLIEWTLAMIAVWCLWNLKYYYLAIFLPVVCTSLLVRTIFKYYVPKNVVQKMILWSFVFVVPLVLVTTLHPNFYPERFMEVVVSSYYEFAALSDPNDIIHYHALEATPCSMLANMPIALVSGLYRPSIIEAHTVFQFIIGLENFILVILSVMALMRVKRGITSRERLLLFSILIYTILLCIFLALSTPNFGTLSRYRVGFLPFLVFVLTLENPLITKIMASNLFRSLVR
ncbi:MAG TPA: hypothetical protein VFD46_12450 [Chryseolinea sp.]|nr:hypothetical protein [Chryseolinea sp.]